MKETVQRPRDLPTATVAMPVVPVPHDAPSNESTRTPDTENHARTSSFERLPPEVRRQILSILDLPGLKALVRASPTFHQQYLHDRRHLLSTSLEITLGSISLDAYILNEVRNPKLSSPGFSNGLLETWRKQYPHRSSFQLAGAVTEDEAADMASFHFKLVAPVARHFMLKTLKVMKTHLGKFKNIADPQPEVSNIEWQRYLRATYRFELLCCFTDPTMPELSHEIAERNADSLFFTPEPWEAEELLCFYLFVENIYMDIFNVMIDKVCEPDPEFDKEDLDSIPWGLSKLDPSCKSKVLHPSSCLDLSKLTPCNRDHSRLPRRDSTPRWS